MENQFNKDYWTNRWEKGETGWDMGTVSTPLKEYIDQLVNKEVRILIPGCGNSYEAEYLWTKGFHNTHVLDFSAKALNQFQQRLPEFPATQMHCSDFFQMTGQFDLILEQTFFCALHPSLRPAYVQQMNDLLLPGGKLVGLLFDENGKTDSPPFGASTLQYQEYLSPSFSIRTLEPAHNSILPRAGRELFFIAVKKAV
jgi:SAM-dependent methyltransferase